MIEKIEAVASVLMLIGIIAFTIHQTRGLIKESHRLKIKREKRWQVLQHSMIIDAKMHKKYRDYIEKIMKKGDL